MGVFLDIANTIKDIKAAADAGLLDNDSLFDRYAKSGKQYSSIAKRASEGTLQFPVLITSAIDIETAQNISKALERNYSTFAQIAFSHSPTETYTKNWSASAYIKKFHQNIGVKTDKHDIVDALNSLVEDSYNTLEDGSMVIASATYESATTKIQANNKEQLFDVMEHLRHDILNNKYIPKSEVIYNFNNNDLNKKYNNMVKVSEDAVTVPNKKLSKPVDLAKDILTDNDVKKSNELVSTTLHIRVRLVNEDNEDMGVVDFIVGIKCIMHAIKSNDMIVNMVNACRNNNKVFNFLRWTTGEISFFKDFLLNINEIKTDVTAEKSGSSHWWSTLKRRKSLANMKDSMFIGKRVLPNASIVISAEEVEFIKTEYGYDLYNPIFFNKIMNTYFLLGFVIVDNAAQVAHFLFEDQSNFQTVTFSALEKSSVNDERKFKEMLKVVNRM